MLFTKIFLLGGLLACHCLVAQVKPNIVYIMADDMGYADLSCYGRKDYQTPHIDRLASQGMKFVNAYSGSALCTPTRTSFMTGRYPARTPVGLWEPLTGSQYDSTKGLSPTHSSLPAMLNNSGYNTYLIGKWHLGFQSEYSPNANGFKEFFGFRGGAIDYISHTGPRGNPDLYENDKPVLRDGYITDILRDRAVEVIRQEHRQPFFLCVMLSAPHWPWQAPGDSIYPLTVDKWRQGGSHSTFARMIKSMDDAVAAIMHALEEKSLEENTVVIFTSDNGGERFSDMGPFRAGKNFLYEGGIRVPAFIRWPGKIAPNMSSDQMAITMDWTATILSLAGAKPDPKFPLDGIDLLPVCTGKQSPVDRTLYWRMAQRHQLKAVRDGKWKYLQDDKGEWLFDLATDPGEKTDLKEKNTKVFETLKTKYAHWETTLLPAIPLPH